MSSTELTPSQVQILDEIAQMELYDAELKTVIDKLETGKPMEVGDLRFIIIVLDGEVNRNQDDLSKYKNYVSTWASN